ncbi:hypothetical protein Q8A73_021637 [Channa argus]|nr:hypothetical protein Q8A73_021637 [Channa argus]
MARDKQNPIILRLITNLVETFQQSTDPDLRRETAAQLEKIIYSQSWLIKLPGVPRVLGVLANFRTGGKLGQTSSGSSDTASSAADPGLIDTASSAADSGPADVTTSAADTSSGSDRPPRSSWLFSSSSRTPEGFCLHPAWLPAQLPTNQAGRA